LLAATTAEECFEDLDGPSAASARRTRDLTAKARDLAEF
jgi:hypothetical protein